MLGVRIGRPARSGTHEGFGARLTCTQWLRWQELYSQVGKGRFSRKWSRLRHKFEVWRRCDLRTAKLRRL